MRRFSSNSALPVLALGFVLAASSVSAQQAAPATPHAILPPQPGISATVQPSAFSPAAEPLSQPGARGRLHAAVVPPVPVPPGPVAPRQIKPAPPTPIAVKKVELHGDDPWNPEWDVLIEENLPHQLLSRHVARDVRPFCPRFNLMTDANKRAFWAYFFQALAGAEAGLKPTADVRHMEPAVAVIDPVTHHIARQEGLLQLSYQDSQRYGCAFNWQRDKNLPTHDPVKTILNPRNNLLCGIRILRNQLIDLHEPLLTPNSYWATLRPGSFSYTVFARQMTNVPEACGQRAIHHHPRFEQRLDLALNKAFFRHLQPAGQTPATTSFQSPR